MTDVNKETFSALVKNPEQLGEASIPQLEALIRAFPFCQISYSLLAKAAGVSDTEKLTTARPKAAAYALSRVALQKLVESNHERYEAAEAVEVAVVPTEIIFQDSEDIVIAAAAPDVAPLPTEKTEEQKRQQKLIEGFIKSNPRISTIKPDQVLVIPDLDLSGRVAQDGTGGIETEAFAKILIRQGKIDKAIDIYQKLILKKPEKKNYFAKKLSELYPKLG